MDLFQTEKDPMLPTATTTRRRMPRIFQRDEDNRVLAEKPPSSE